MKKKSTHLMLFDDTSSVVVVGAHPDDAVRACGGVMLRALSLGRATAGLSSRAPKLTVIAVTDGAALFGKTGIPDGRRTACARKAEQAKALKALGVPKRNTFHLGFPDGGIPKLRHRNRTERSGAYFCPWLDSDRTNDASYAPGIDFTGNNLTHILMNLLAAAKPPHVFTHHARDKHPDHRGVTWFVRKALAELRKSGVIDAAPAIYEYLTYVSGTPWPPAGPAVPVKAAKALPFGGRVVNLRLAPAEIKRKDAALDCLTPTLGPDYIAHWRRTNEIYWRC